MRVSKAFLVGCVGVIVILGLVWQFWLRGEVAYARLATAYGAKKVCSCLYVAEREMNSCLGDFTEDVSIVKFSAHEDGEAKVVEASVLSGLVKDRAVYRPGLGCALERKGR